MELTITTPIGLVMVSSTCQTKFGDVKAGDLVRLGVQTQWGVAFLIFCAAGAELASGRQELYFCCETLEAAGGGWSRSRAATIASAVD